MSLIKPPVLPTWADSGDQVQPSNAEIQVGWPLTNTPPARQRWNWLLNYLMNGVRYFARRGMPDYGADETYMTGDRVIGDDGKTYRSLQDANTGHTPSTSPLWWERWGWTQSELDTYINGKQASFIVRAASTAAINLASPGAAIDGVTMVAGDRFLEKDNGTAANRGIYVWNGAAVAATRATDADTGAELKSGIIIEVTEGTANADTLWTLTTDGTITIGVTGLTFAQTNAGVYLAKSGGSMTGLLNLKAGAAIASAATLNLSTATGNTVHITGTTATSAVTLNAGQWMECIADAAWPLTYHATNNKLNTGGANYTCAAGDSVFYFYDGTTVYGQIVKADGTPVVTASNYMLVRDEKTLNTDGGSSSAGIQTRVLNTVVSNSIAGASLASNQITLPAGTYRIFATAPAYNTDAHQLILYNVTDSSTIAVGTSENGITAITTQGFLEYRFTLAATKVLELRHFIQNATTTNGLGLHVGNSTEVYSVVKLTKE